MDYEKQYKEVLDNASVIHKAGNQDVKQIMEQLFPELKESEDKRIRKGLIKAVSGTMEGNTLFGTDVTREEALAWLEKQGEQKEATCVADIIDRLTEKEQEILFKELDMQKEQKSAEWSKEDETILQGICDEILANKHDAKECEWKTYDKFLDWLKSLKDRYAWKPSDAQMNAVLFAEGFVRGHCAEKIATELASLYEQLKELKGE